MSSIKKTTSILVIIAFLVNNFSYGLSPLPASKNPAVKPYVSAMLYQQQVKYADSDYAKNLLAENDASAVLLNSGKILVSKDIKDQYEKENPFSLLSEIKHEQFEALMQLLKRRHENKYKIIRNYMCQTYPTEISDEIAVDLYINHLMARAFQWISMIEENLMVADQVPFKDRILVKNVQKLIDQRKELFVFYDNKRSEQWNFFNNGYCVELLQKAVSSGERFYEVASTNGGKSNYEKIQLNFLRTSNDPEQIKRTIKALVEIKSSEALEIMHQRNLNEKWSSDLKQEIVFALEKINGETAKKIINHYLIENDMELWLLAIDAFEKLTYNPSPNDRKLLLEAWVLGEQSIMDIVEVKFPTIFSTISEKEKAQIEELFIEKLKQANNVSAKKLLIKKSFKIKSEKALKAMVSISRDQDWPEHLHVLIVQGLPEVSTLYAKQLLLVYMEDSSQTIKNEIIKACNAMTFEQTEEEVNILVKLWENGSEEMSAVINSKFKETSLLDLMSEEKKDKIENKLLKKLRQNLVDLPTIKKLKEINSQQAIKLLDDNREKLDWAIKIEILEGLKFLNPDDAKEKIFYYLLDLNNIVRETARNVFGKIEYDKTIIDKKRLFKLWVITDEDTLEEIEKKNPTLLDSVRDEIKERVEKQLIIVLNSEIDTEKLRAAIIKLGKLKSKKGFKLMCALDSIKVWPQSVRALIVEQVKNFEHEKEYLLLLNYIIDEDPAIRLQAVSTFLKMNFNINNDYQRKSLLDIWVKSGIYEQRLIERKIGDISVVATADEKKKLSKTLLGELDSAFEMSEVETILGKLKKLKLVENVGRIHELSLIRKWGYSIRIEVVKLIGEISTDEAKEVLLEYLNDVDNTVKEFAKDSLIKQRYRNTPEDRERLLNIWRMKDESLEKIVEQKVGEISSFMNIDEKKQMHQLMLEQIKKIITAKDLNHYIRKVIKLKFEAGLFPLYKISENEKFNWLDSRQLIRALESFPQYTSKRLLLKYLVHEDLALLDIAKETFKKMEYQPTEEDKNLLKRAFIVGDQEVALVAIEKMQQLKIQFAEDEKKEIEQQLIEDLKKKTEKKELKAIIHKLGYLKSEHGLRVMHMLSVEREWNPFIERHIAKALGLVGGEAAKELIEYYLDQENYNVQVEAIESFKNIKYSNCEKDKRALLFMQVRKRHILKDKVSLKIAESKVEIDDKEKISFLIELLAEEENMENIRNIIETLLETKEFNEKINSFINVDIARVKEQIISSMTDHFYFLKSKSVDSIQNDIRIFRKLLSIVYSNFPLVLDAYSASGLSNEDLEKLMKGIPYNNALTRVMRMLGEPGSIVGGYSNIFRIIVEGGAKDRFLEWVIELAKEKKQAITVEVEGLLEHFRLSGITVKTKEEWDEFLLNIEGYYSIGFTVMRPLLYDLYIKHKDNPAQLRFFQSTIAKEFSSMEDGTFWGFSDEVKETYGIDDKEEMSLIGAYVPIVDMGLNDTFSIYHETKKALIEQGVERWQKQISSNYRARYETRKQVVRLQYQGEEKEKEQLILYLKDLFNKKRIKKAAKSLFIMDEVILDDITATILSMIMDEAGMQKAKYENIPEEITHEQIWLSEWSTLIMDTVIEDNTANIKKIVGGAVVGCSFTIEQIEQRISFMLLDLNAKKKKIPKADNQIIEEIKLKNTSAIKDHIKRKVLVQIKFKDLEDEELYEQWVSVGLAQYIKHVKNRANIEDEDLKPFVKECFLAARKEYLLEIESEKRNIYTLRREQLVETYLKQIIKHYEKIDNQIKEILGKYKEAFWDSDENFTIGFNDDLLHLAGEFMLSGVCTRTERPVQVRNGKSNGYHFGTIAIKDDKNVFLGVSQVQISKTGIVGRQKEDPQGYKVLALPGINLRKGSKDITVDDGVKAILKTAKKIADKAGLQGAVVPVRPGIHSNQGAVKAVIQELVKKGILKQVKLESDIKLSEGYSYDMVYEIGNIDDVEIFQKGYSDKKKLDEEAVVKGVKQIDLIDGIGSVKGHDQLIVINLATKINEVITRMPVNTIEQIKNNIDIYGQTIKISYNIKSKRTSVTKNEAIVDVVFGRDVLYGSNKIETVKLAQVIAEALVAISLDEYNELKKMAKTNENAYFKIEILKGLLLYRYYYGIYNSMMSLDAANFSWQELSDENKKQKMKEYSEQLEKTTQGMDEISQKDMFQNIVNDQDPMFLVMNYLYILFDRIGVEEEDIEKLIYEIGNLEFLGELSLSKLRNAVKQIMLNGEVGIDVGGTTETKQEFRYFDDTKELSQFLSILNSTIDENQFYIVLKRLYEYALPFSEEKLNLYMKEAVDEDLFNKNRYEVEKNFYNILRRELGTQAISIITQNLSGKFVEKEDLSTIEMLKAFIGDEDDADVYREILNHEWEEAEDQNIEWAQRLFSRPRSDEFGDTNISKGNVDEKDIHKTIEKAAEKGQAMAIMSDEISNLKDLNEDDLVNKMASNLYDIDKKSVSEKIKSNLRNKIDKNILIEGLSYIEQLVKGKDIRIVVINEENEKPTMYYKDKDNNVLAHTGKGKKTKTNYKSIYIGYKALKRVVENSNKQAISDVVEHELRDMYRTKHLDDLTDSAKSFYDELISLNEDAENAKALFFDNLVPSKEKEVRKYIIRYDKDKISVKAKETLNEYQKLLERVDKDTKIEIKIMASRNLDNILEVQSELPDGTGQSNIRISEKDINLKAYPLRIVGLLNLAIASATIPTKAKDMDVKEFESKYGHLLGFIRAQFNSLSTSEIQFANNSKEIMKAIKTLIISLPPCEELDHQQLSEHFDKMLIALRAA